MVFAQIDDQMPDHPKLLAAGPMAGWVFVCGICYCARMLTDGFIPTGQVRKLADIDDVTPLVTRLITAGLWEETAGGYRVHDYTAWNPTAEQVKERRAKSKQRQDRWRGVHLEPSIKEGSNGVSNASQPPSTNASYNASRNAVSHTVPTPTPTPMYSSPNGEGVPAKPETPPAKRAPRSAVTPSPKPNKSGELIDLIEAQSVPVAMTDADHSALKRAPMTAVQVAEVYVAIASGEYGDDWTQEHLSVQTAIKTWAAYENRKTAPRPAPRTNGRVYPGTGAVMDAFRQQDERGGLDGFDTFTGRREMGSGETQPRLPG